VFLISLPNLNQEKISVRKVEGGVVVVDKFNGKLTKDFRKHCDHLLLKMILSLRSGVCVGARNNRRWLRNTRIDKTYFFISKNIILHVLKKLSNSHPFFFFFLVFLS